MEQNLQITTNRITHLVQPLQKNTQKKMLVNHMYVHNISYDNVNKNRMCDSWPLKVVPIGFPETSIINYQYSPRNNPEEHRHLPQSDQSTTVPELQILCFVSCLTYPKVKRSGGSCNILQWTSCILNETSTWICHDYVTPKMCLILKNDSKWTTMYNTIPHGYWMESISM